MKTKFDVYDYLIFFFILVVSIGIGLFFGFHLNEKLKKLVGKLFKKSSREVKPAADENGIDLVEQQYEEGDKEAAAAAAATMKDEVGEEGKGEEENVKTMEYLTANHSMSAFPIALSLLATFFSSSSLLGFPAEVYQYGIQYWIIVFGVCLVPLIGAFVTGPFFQSLDIVSVFEYLKLRYDSEAARLLGVTLYMIRTFIAMGIVIYGPATALSSLTDLGDDAAILMIGLIATFYTAIGGIKAVIWTDAFQTLIMFSGVIAVIVKGIYDVGGISNLFEICYYGGRLNFFNFDPNPVVRQSFWSLLIGGTVAWTMSYAIDQQMIQRFKAAKTQRTAQVALLLNIPGIILLISFCCFTGLVLYANFSDCDPLSAASFSGVKNPNQLLPYFVMLKFNSIIFIPGLFLSSIFCASLSSVSSALNSMSACIWRDYLMRFKVFKNADDRHSSITTKIISLVCGLVCIAMGFLISKSDSNLIQISSTINGALQAPIIGIFFVSSLFPMMNIYGLYAGALSGFGIGFWLGLGSFIVKPNYPKLPLITDGCSNATMITTTTTTSTTATMMLRNTATNLHGFNQIYGLSYMWLSPVGVLTVIIVGVLVSFITNFFIERRQVHDSLILYRYKSYLRSKETSKETLQ